MVNSKVNSKTKAKRKYNEKTYKKVSVYVKNNEMRIIESFCKDRNYSKNNLFVESVKEKVQRELGKSIDELLKELQTIEESKISDSEKVVVTENIEEWVPNKVKKTNAD